MRETATVTTRPCATSVAVIFPAASISDMIQPPKMWPIGLVSVDIASVREASAPRGSAASSLAPPSCRCVVDCIAAPLGNDRSADPSTICAASQHKQAKNFFYPLVIYFALHN